MPTSLAVSRRAVWGLWCCLTLAAVGLVLVVAGALDARTEALWSGGAIMGFATMVYLLVHFWATATASLASPSAAEPAPVARPARPFVKPRAARSDHRFDERVGWEAPPAPRASSEAAPAAPEPRPVMVAASGNGHASAAPVSAVERRKEWIDQMPLAKSILETRDAPRPAAEPVPEGKTRGRCSGCNTILVAPATRPIRLRCPTCGRVAWLQ